MRTGDFCRYKACGKITKHISGYCHIHNKLWVKGYEQAIKDIQRQGVFNFDAIENEQQINSETEATSSESEEPSMFRMWCPGAK